MPAKGKHRRPKQHHALTRKLALAGTGSAALALPLISATTAGAAEAKAPAVVKAAPAAEKAAPAAAKAAPLTYSVVSGDTLSKIAAEHSVGGGWQKLYEANRNIVGADPAVIRPGLKLNLTAAAPAAAKPAAAKTTAAKATTGYANNLDGWIRESLDVMAQHGIPGSYAGIHRNIMRESSGNPMAINNWDINAQNGIPSKGLLQVIDPTFRAYHVPGTSQDSYDPVANITAACNYAAARYGTIDNVNGAY
ncbi:MULTISPECIES: LysM peptidoglycan-binding domain-containing protein [unclassified Streptomyces]|uniref:LysM peptidoglycan-binding domain-containing protein n=1 Tax=unclassified Streptomyces TaxID=2593676 RepID=UPI000DC7D19E|nr:MULTISPECIES: LysM peptidoglycan-binding domain-containing protein [unclassified Streptomyces]AWZ09388.1 peptidoglycan-binding protein [Streptomyces sp. ICC4]AWZ15295.1 peptidoglycan-binding protein [Streptomyces sp. ICC1]